MNDMPCSEAKSGLRAGKFAMALAIGNRTDCFFLFDRDGSIFAGAKGQSGLLVSPRHICRGRSGVRPAYVACDGTLLPAPDSDTGRRVFVRQLFWGTSSLIWGRRQARRSRFGSLSAARWG